MSIGFVMDETTARLNSHEEVCAERYKQIWARLSRLETILLTSVGFIIATLVALVMKLQ